MAEVGWTDEQLAAITAPAHVLLSASAGTGKTTTIIGKVLWRLGLSVGRRGSTDEPVPPCPDPVTLDQIAAITFTEKAAYDLKEKLRREIGRADGGDRWRWEVDSASVGTIHGFCADLLRDHALRLGIDPTFRILDVREARLEQDRTIREAVFDALDAEDSGATSLVERFGLQGFRHQAGVVGLVRDAMRDIRWRRGRYAEWVSGDELDPGRLAARFTDSGADPTASEGDEALADAAALYRLGSDAIERWLRWLHEENVRDFDSLILDARELLTSEETRPALEAIRARYRILIIDEFQDTDAAQRDIAFAIAGIGSDPPPVVAPQLFLVGDAKQSIYGFRGADISVWNEVREAICGDDEPLRLSQNFRSDPAVIAFVNRCGARALGETARELAAESPERRIDYDPLEPALDPSAAGGLEWLANDEKGAVQIQREAEARMVASRIVELSGVEQVRDPLTGALRECTYADIAVIARKRDNLFALETGLRDYGIPFYNVSAESLAGRQEVIDLVTILRVIEDPRDDYHAFGFLRSPNVGLRDETLARIWLDRLTGDSPLLRQAERYLETIAEGDLIPFDAPESPLVLPVELEALERGLVALSNAQRLVNRADPRDLLETVIEETGYKLHLAIRGGSDEAYANIERFLAIVEEYRHLPLRSFLGVWDAWAEEDVGVPQAPLFSHDDDVVTLTTIHGAKGLEWPVVIVAGSREGPSEGRRLTNGFWSDARFGPVLLPRSGERSERSTRLFERAVLEEAAEEARLLYVATTRARDRLIISGPTDEEKGYAQWLRVGLEDAVEAHDPAARVGAKTPEEVDRSAGSYAPPAVDAATRTGRQIDVFGFDDVPVDESGQISLFAARRETSDNDCTDGVADAAVVGHILPAVRPFVIHRRPAAIQGSLGEPPVSLRWLADIELGESSELACPIPVDRLRFTTSATEMMIRERDPEAWSRQFEHGVIPEHEFAPASHGDGGLPATLRGTVIHGVLERIRHRDEVSRILQVTIAGIDAPEIEVLLDPESAYRQALEREIAGVVESPEWSWYLEGEPRRELRFVHLAADREWRVGAFDLYRPASAPVVATASPAPELSLFAEHPAEPATGGDAAGTDGADGADGGVPPGVWIIDFKTHEIEPGDAPRVAREYETQARVYRSAAEALGSETPAGGRVRVALHFTRPNVAIRIP